LRFKRCLLGFISQNRYKKVFLNKTALRILFRTLFFLLACYC